MEIRKMSGPSQKKPGGKKHGKQSRKPDQLPNQEPKQLRSQKPDQLHSPPPEPQPRVRPEPQPSRQPAPPLSQKPEPLLSAQPELQRSRKPEPLLSQKPEPLPSPQPAPLQSQKPAPLLSPQPESQQDCKKQVDAEIASANTPLIDFQTIAMAYGNYTKKSFAETKAYVEKLSGVRSLDKIVEIQSEFAKQAYETFVTESTKIRELYSGLAKQNLKPFEGLVTRKNKAAH
jgi:hypothetical protein